MNAIAEVSFKAPHHPLRSLLLEDLPAAIQVEDEISRRMVTIRAADSEGHRSSAHILVSRMYAQRGYRSTPLGSSANSSRVTLIASDHDVTLGTITIGFDDDDGLLVDELFGDHVERLRADGAVLCEFVKLAIDGVVRSKRVLASLFHTAFIYAREIKGCRNLLIEVNPRHVRFYESMLGFSVLAQERINRRVDAPAVLMCLDLAHAGQQIGRIHAGPDETRRSDRSFYRDCFSPDEAAGIVRRLRRRNDA